jgi:hypothetical protein
LEEESGGKEIMEEFNLTTNCGKLPKVSEIDNRILEVEKELCEEKNRIESRLQNGKQAIINTQLNLYWLERLLKELKFAKSEHDKFIQKVNKLFEEHRDSDGWLSNGDCRIILDELNKEVKT